MKHASRTQPQKHKHINAHKHILTTSERSNLDHAAIAGLSLNTCMCV